jgi:nicotinamide-nucleotide amidase
VSNESPKASVLAIGTELTSGQTLNRNAAWISERLTTLGFEVILHETVADDHLMITDALNQCTEKTDLVVVTGGLGPTTDDFTRDVLASWSTYPLEKNEKSWAKIVSRLTERGIEVAASNEQQAYFPRGATVLENLEGTADGFRFTHADSEIVVLPGPPREGTHVWDRHIAHWLPTHFKNLKPERLLRFHCLGKSESALGEVVESALQGSGIKTGYRASMPYVEVKLWLPDSISDQDVKTHPALLKFKMAIAPWLAFIENETLTDQLFKRLEEKTGTLPITFLDVGTKGLLTERLVTALKQPAGRKVSARIEIMTRYEGGSDPETLPHQISEWYFGLFAGGKSLVLNPEGKKIETLPEPYTGPLMQDRLGRYHVEAALQTWIRALS